MLQRALSGSSRSAGPGTPARNSAEPDGKALQSPQASQPVRSNQHRLSQPTETCGAVSSGEQTTHSQDDRSSSHDDEIDTDSARIVQMALSLSESRRIASRRQTSRAAPPRLGPMPDASSGSNLQKHFQQQRKSSHSNPNRHSPRLQQGHSPRLASRALDSPLAHTSFEGVHDGHFSYQFSPSTLARAQKAKDHLELMAQYRRLLDVLPPLKSGSGRNLAASPPGSPIARKSFNFGGHGDSGQLGRQYNPLQYIRNRKVRARERKVIDGEKQGFRDLDSVKPWVDRAVERATSFAANPDDGNCVLPPFPDARDALEQPLPDSLSRTATRARRPRVDWFVEPCDIMADAYWLELGNHKELIEDRNWRKIFPPLAPISRTVSRDATVDPCDVIPPFSLQDDDPLNGQISGVSKVDTATSHNSAKDRAKQTLHNIRAFPHRHNASNLHSDFMWHKRDSASASASASDISGSESEQRKVLNKLPGPRENDSNGSVQRNSKPLLDAQGADMMVVAKDACQTDVSKASGAAVSDTEPFPPPGTLKTPERNPLSQRSSRHRGRKESLVDASDSDQRGAFDSSLLLGSPMRNVAGRQSLHVMDQSRKDAICSRDSSAPTSPELQPARVNTEPMTSTQHALAPSLSRSESPHKNPISKIKQIIRHKSSGDCGILEQDDRWRPAALEPDSSEKMPWSEGRQSTSSQPSLPVALMPLEPVKTHLRTGSGNRPWPEEQAGLRGIFRGPRIDTVIRGGVSKLGDMLRKKDDGGYLPADMETTDESGGEGAQGRSGSSVVSRRPSRRAADGQSQSQSQSQPKNFLDSMPQFNRIHEENDAPPAGNPADDSANLWHQSLQQPNLLRPLRMGPQSVSPSASAESRPAKLGESDASESDSRRGGGNISDRLRDADGRSTSLLGSCRAEDDGRSTKSGRWPIANKGTPTEQTRLMRREIVRFRALVLSTGIKAMEISRRAQEAHKPFEPGCLATTDCSARSGCAGIAWTDIAKLCPDTAAQIADGSVACYELYSVAGRCLHTAIQTSGRRWQASADQFTSRTCLQLQNRIGDVRSRIADDLLEKSRQAGDTADETSRDLALGQPLKVKAVVDTIEKMLRRRRRRLRWLRRALWLTVEWLLVGFMWYVWFMVMILRVFLALGKGFVRAARWLLWL